MLPMISGFFAQHGYYFFLSVGALSMVGLTIWHRKEYDLSVFASVCFSLLLLVCGILGAKLLFYIESGFQSFSGMSFFGAVFLVMLFMPVVGFLFRLKPLQSLDACASCVASIIGFMRFGCFCAGCCGGIACTIGTASFLWPTQLIEGVGDMLILVFLITLEQKKQTGCLYPVFLLLYGIMRFLIEFLRATPKIYLGLSEGQWLALLGIIIGTLFLAVLKTSSRKCSIDADANLNKGDKSL